MSSQRGLLKTRTKKLKTYVIEKIRYKEFIQEVQFLEGEIPEREQRMQQKENYQSNKKNFPDSQLEEPMKCPAQ